MIGCAIAAIYIFLFPSANEGGLLFRYLVSLFLIIYPQLSFWYYIKSDYSSRVELNYLLVDMFLIGLAAGLLHFALVPSTVFLVVVLSTLAGLGDHKHFIISVFSVAVGALLAGLIEGLRYQPDAPILVEATSLLFLLFGMTSRNYFYNKRTLEFLAAKQEIRAQKEEIEASLKEKEILLREVHHRVKNNLQLVYSLLNLQQGGLTDPRAIETVSASKQRIKIISLVHEALYKTDEAREVDIAVYLAEIVKHIQQLTAEADSLQIETQIQPVLLDLTKAVPLGLIINEIVNNSIEHAFNDTQANKKVFMAVECREDKIELRVSDNGEGFSDMSILEDKHSQTLGLSLIKDLVRQLKGDLSIESNGGVSYLITFPYRDE